MPQHKENDLIPGGLGDNETLSDIAKKHGMSIEAIKTQFETGIKIEREHTGSIQKAAEIALDHLTEYGDYYEKLEIAEMKMNSLDKAAEIRYIRHCKAGLAEYPEETILIKDECLKKMMPSMAGIPIYIDHVNDVDMEEAEGYVVECIYNQLDGCYWAKCLITDFNAFQKVENGWGASNAYIPNQMGIGGLYHGAKYNREVLDARYTHLAIVKNPRYNESLVLTPEEYKQYNKKLDTELKELQNSLDTKEQKENEPMAKDEKGFFDHVKAFFNSGDEEEKENCKKNEEDDKDKKIKELEEKLNEANDTIKGFEEKKNAEEADEKSEKGDEEKPKENEDEKEEEKEDEKQNSQFFNSLKEAREKGQSGEYDKVKIYSQADGLALGKQIFS